ncbi:MAG: hypothetical protein E7351_02510 [Clostridiales bacterium]|nr:hypothetical protein [Clostridiales bacterium]
MNRISRKNLEFFYEEMHQVELNKIKDYDFTKNYDILKELVGNGIYNESDFQTYVYNGNISM